MEEYVTLADLKSEFMLSPKWIQRLGPPDTTKTNPHYRSGPPMKLWLRDRVMGFITANPEDYAKRCKEFWNRSKSAKQVADKKRDECARWAESVKIDLLEFPRNLRAACEEHLDHHYECLSAIRGECMLPPVNIHDRHIMNMLRHAFTNYETLLQECPHLVGFDKAYEIIKRRVNQLVCEKAGLECDLSPYRNHDIWNWR